MFPHKTNAIHAGYSTKKPFRIKTFVFLASITLLLGVFAFTEARADSDAEYCGYIERQLELVISNLKLIDGAYAEETKFENLKQWDEIRALKTKKAAEWATVYNAMCKD